MRPPRLVPLALLAVAGCALRNPVLYSHPDLEREEEAAAARDVEECKQVGEAEASTDAGAAVAHDVTMGGLLGATAGAVGGAIWGAAGHGAAAGAAAGAATALLSSLIVQPQAFEPAYEAAVDRCLADRGYEVIGWR